MSEHITLVKESHDPSPVTRQSGRYQEDKDLLTVVTPCPDTGVKLWPGNSLVRTLTTLSSAPSKPRPRLSKPVIIELLTLSVISARKMCQRRPPQAQICVRKGHRRLASVSETATTGLHLVMADVCLDCHIIDLQWRKFHTDNDGRSIILMFDLENWYICINIVNKRWRKQTERN